MMVDSENEELIEAIHLQEQLIAEQKRFIALLKEKIELIETAHKRDRDEMFAMGAEAERQWGKILLEKRKRGGRRSLFAEFPELMGTFRLWVDWHRNDGIRLKDAVKQFRKIMPLVSEKEGRRELAKELKTLTLEQLERAYHRKRMPSPEQTLLTECLKAGVAYEDF